ncbi:MAG: SUMF1/EgtB/PvdO family nonheme iron enzyme, partial [Prevotellaceae bacterium]|nr:SUMF1/EgtB/PvdO family nonheme iron enzyme [Prevotellaceae bacterium]
WYGSYVNGSVTDPAGVAAGSYRVLRGGHWNGSAVNCRVSYRNDYSPYNYNSTIGFRVVVSFL